MPKQFCRLSVVCLSSVVTHVHCAKTDEPFGKNFGLSVAPDENSTALKFGDDRFMGWGTVPPNDPQNGQIRAFSCTVAERVICLRRFSAECWYRQGNIVLKRSDDRSRGWGTVPPNVAQNGQIHAFSCTVGPPKRVIRLRRLLAKMLAAAKLASR